MDFDVVRPMFGGSLSQTQVDGINTILSAFKLHGDGSRMSLAYLLATTKHETADTMQPIHERGAKAYFAKYEPGTSIGKNLGNTLKGDGYRFRGRGYVQITGRANYAKAGKKLGRDLIAKPDDALLPDVAAFILIRGCIEGWFTGKKLGDYTNFYNMRRVVNGTDKAPLIASYADIFEEALQRASVAKPAKPAPAPPPKPAVAAPVAPARAGFWAMLLKLIPILFGRKPR